MVRNIGRRVRLLRRFNALPTATATIALLAALSVVGSSQTAPVTLRSDSPAPQVSCGTRVDEGLRGIRPRAVQVADGETLSFEQDPPILLPNYSGRVTLRQFSVVGDVPTLEFHRWNPDNPASDVETWQRTTTRGAIGGRLISIFEPSWDATFLDLFLSRFRIGYDRPSLYLGSISVAGVDRPVSLRMGSAGMPHSDVVPIDGAAQYASNILNLVIPGFGDGRASAGSYGFELSTATERALKLLSDSYDDIAFVPVAIPVADFGAFHQNVQNAVSGINIPLFNQTSVYGKSQRLQGVEIYADAAAARYEDTNHEMAHQWNSDFDWGRIAGISRAGHSPAAHSPLWTGGESLLGAVLWPNRRVRASGSTFAIEATPAPAHFHPLELYGMGLLPAEQVPEFQVFEEQGQFDATTSATPAVDAPVIGGIRSVTINDVIREHGVRTGPRPTLWRRATVLVSTERLASQAEMDYWNFFAQRLADLSGAGTPTYEGYVPFHTATREAVQLTTAIELTGRPSLSQALDTDAPSFGGADWRGVEFTQTVPSRLAPGAVLRLAGHVTATDRADFSQMSLVFYRANSPDPVRFSGSVSRSGDFAVDVRFTDAQQGRYSIGVYLFWPNSGSQYARTARSTFVVQ